MSERFPDIEIYVKGVDLMSIIGWLRRHFDIIDQERQDDSHGLTLSRGGRDVECLIVEKAAKGGFTSVWLKSDNTHWANDRDCALDAATVLDCEVRCSAGSWQETEERPGWLRITPDSETPINWL